MHGLMLNACQVKLNIGIELYRTTKHKNAKSVVFIYAQFRVGRQEDKIVKRRVIEQVAEYKYIPRHMHIISFF